MLEGVGREVKGFGSVCKWVNYGKELLLRGLEDFRNISRGVQYANDGDLLCRGLKKDHVVAMRA